MKRAFPSINSFTLVFTLLKTAASLILPTTSEINEAIVSISFSFKPLVVIAAVPKRIPDVINAKPGYVPTEQMGELNYRTKPLNEYVK